MISYFSYYDFNTNRTRTGYTKEHIKARETGATFGLSSCNAHKTSIVTKPFCFKQINYECQVQLALLTGNGIKRNWVVHDLWLMDDKYLEIRKYGSFICIMFKDLKFNKYENIINREDIKGDEAKKKILYRNKLLEKFFK